MRVVLTVCLLMCALAAPGWAQGAGSPYADARLAVWAEVLDAAGPDSVASLAEADLRSDAPHPFAAHVWTVSHDLVGDLDDALTQADPALRRALGALPRIADLDRRDEDAQILREFGDLRPAEIEDPWVLFLLTSAYQARARYTEALPFAVELTRRHPDLFDGPWKLSQLARGNLQLRQRVLALAGPGGELAETPAGAFLRAVLEPRPWDREVAIRAVDEWIDLYPHDAGALRFRALEMGADDAGRAEVYARIEEVYPFRAVTFDYAEDHAAVLLQAGREDEAWAAIERSVGRSVPDSTERNVLTVVRRARALRSADTRDSRACRLLEEGMDRHSDRRLLTAAAALCSPYSISLEAGQRLVEESPQSSEGYEALFDRFRDGWKHMVTAEVTPDAAVEVVEAAREAVTDPSQRLFWLMSQVLWRADRSDERVGLLQRAQAEYPESDWMMREAADALSDAGRHSEAMSVLRGSFDIAEPTEWDVGLFQRLVTRTEGARALPDARVALAAQFPWLRHVRGGSLWDVAERLGDISAEQPAPPIRVEAGVQTGHRSGENVAVAFSPDGRLVATIGQISRYRYTETSPFASARLWDRETGRLLRVLDPAIRGGSHRVSFSPDGRLVAAHVEETDETTGSRPDVDVFSLWDAATGAVVRRVEVGESELDAVLGPRGLFLLHGRSYFNLTTGDRVWTALGEAHRGRWEPLPGTDLALRKPQRQVGDVLNDYQVWNVSSGHVLRDVRGELAALSPDGRWLAYTRGGRLAVIGVEEGAVRSRWETDADALAFTDAGAVVTVHRQDVQEGAIRLWDAATGGLLRSAQLDLPTEQMLDGLTFSPDGSTLAVSYSGRVQLVDIPSGNGYALLESDVDAPIGHAALDGTGSVVALADQLHVWPLSGGRTAAMDSLDRYAGTQVTDFAYSSDRSLVAVSDGWNTVIHDGTTGVQVGEPIRGVLRAFGSEDHLVVDGGRGLDVIDLSGGTRDPLRILQADDQFLNQLNWPCQREYCATARDGPSYGSSVSVSRDGRLVAEGQLEGRLLLWESGELAGAGLVSGSTDEPLHIRRVALTERRAPDIPDPVILALRPDGTSLAAVWLGGVPRIALFHSDGSPQSDLPHDLVQELTFSSDGSVLVSGSQDGSLMVWDADTGDPIGSSATHGAAITSIDIAPDSRRLVTAGEDGAVTVWDRDPPITGGATLGPWHEVVTLYAFRDGSWAAVDARGRYDASSRGAISGLHWVYGTEVIELDQLKARYWEPGLLDKLFGTSAEPLRDVDAFEGAALPLHPVPEITEAGPDRVRVAVTDRGGGIGRVRVWLNGAEVSADARPPGAASDADTLEAQVDLAPFRRLLLPDSTNVVEVLAENAAGWLRSRRQRADFYVPAARGPNVEDGGGTDDYAPHLWAVVAGVGDYRGSELDLRYAGKDAVDMADALRVAAGGLFSPGRTHVTLLTTEDAPGAQAPTRARLLAALDSVAARADARDVLVVYLSGHGTVHGGPDGDFYYLTREAASGDLSDPGTRRTDAVASDTLAARLAGIPARKQVLILDTCASGRVVERLTASRDVPGAQIRSLDRLNETTGTFVLAGSAADAVSYEASQYGQGLLTWSLLDGMRQAVDRPDNEVDVMAWFQHAERRVPELARTVGGVQKPELVMPRGRGTYPIGRVTAAEQDSIRLRSPRPVVLRSSFQDERFGDALGLTRAANQALREASLGERTGRGGPALVYVDAEGYPDALRLAGRYSESDGTVRVEARLISGREVVVDLPPVEGPADPAALAAELVRRAEVALDGRP